MGRVKHTVRFVLLVAAIIAAALLALAVKPVSDYARYETASVARLYGGAVNMEIKNGAEASFYEEDGALVFKVIQRGEEYDDVCVTITFPEATYDTEKLAENLGVDSGAENSDELTKKIISAYEKGAYLAKMNFSFSAARSESVADAYYSLSFGGGEAQEREVYFRDDAKTLSTGEFKLVRGEAVKMKIVFGAKEGGAMRSGKYYLTSSLEITGLAENPLSVWERIGIGARAAGTAFGKKGLAGLLGESSLLTVYGLFCAFLGLAFLWKDLRNSFTLAGAVVTKKYFKDYAERIFLRGELICDGEISTSGMKLLASVFLGIIFYALWLALAPIRIIVLAAADIYFAVTGDIYEARWSICGNLLLGAGFVFVLLGAGAMAANSVIIGLLIGIFGAAALFFGNFLCKNAVLTVEE